MRCVSILCYHLSIAYPQHLLSSCATGTETLIEHRASIEPEDGRVSPDGLLRVSAGLENIEDIKKDLSQAIEIAGNVANKSE